MWRLAVNRPGRRPPGVGPGCGAQPRPRPDGLAVHAEQVAGYGPVGRDAEIAEICAFLATAAGTPAALVIVGDIGIGRTTVWRQGGQAAAGRHPGASCPPAPPRGAPAFAGRRDPVGAGLDEV